MPLIECVYTHSINGISWRDKGEAIWHFFALSRRTPPLFTPRLYVLLWYHIIYVSVLAMSNCVLLIKTFFLYCIFYLYISTTLTIKCYLSNFLLHLLPLIGTYHFSSRNVTLRRRQLFLNQPYMLKINYFLSKSHKLWK